MFKGHNITCVVYILALYFYNSGGLRVFNHFLRLISFLFCYFLIFLMIFSLVIFLNFFLNFLKKQALVSYKIFLIKKKSVWACQYIAYDYLAHWLWYWVTIPKVQGSNPGLTTNLWPSFGLCSVVQPQFSSKFPALALNRPGTLVPIPPASQGISKLAYIARWRCTLNVKVANLEVDRFTQTANLSTLEPNYHIPQRTQA